MNVRAVVMAAGKGTRMKSRRPKVLHELCGRPMLWHVLAALRDAGVTETLVVVNRELEPHVAGLGLSREGFRVRTVLQEPQNGTGHAVQVALAGLAAEEGTILVASGDMPLVPHELFSQVIEARGPHALALVTAKMPLPSNFGRIVRGADGMVEKIVELRDCSAEQAGIDEMNAALYAFDEGALRAVIGSLSAENAQRELYLTDTVELFRRAGKRVVPVVAADHEHVLGINDRVELARARVALNLRLCERYMRDGVTIVDPATTYVEPELALGSDTLIYPNTTIARLSVIGSDCVIGPNARLSAAKLGNRVVVSESVVVDSEIGEGVRIGPFAHLRGGTAVSDGASIGNFVEMKNARFGPGSKVMHLSYVGDSDVGEKSNIGAGTITCNYDGEKKHRTTIGERVFIGSNSSLVAPLTIGDGAATGAGSVVIRDVAAGERVVGNPARPLRPSVKP